MLQNVDNKIISMQLKKKKSFENMLELKVLDELRKCD